MHAFLLQALTPVAAVALLVTAFIALGNQADHALQDHDRFQVAFADLDCVPPGPMERLAFLREAQYQADAPDTFSRLDPDTPGRIREWFLQHPWVKDVERVAVRPSGAVEVILRYREPVLAVPGWERVHAVDADGVLLPRSAPTDSLPLLRVDRSRPQGAGKPWGREGVTAAARTAAQLKSGGDRLPVVSMEYVRGDLVLWTASGCRVVWGRPPDQERDDEPNADLKRERLLTSLEEVAASPLPVEIDLRPASGAARRLLVAERADSRR